MSYRAILLLVLGLVTARLFADEAQFFDSDPDKTLRVTLTTEDLERSPSWKTSADNPPLSAKKALQLATAKRLQIAKDRPDWKWELESLALKQADDTTDKWFWLVHFECFPTKGGIGGGLPDLRLVVLMDGRVIEPKVADEN
jgi:hypothetical protein